MSPDVHDEGTCPVCGPYVRAEARRKGEERAAAMEPPRVTAEADER